MYGCSCPYRMQECKATVYEIHVSWVFYVLKVLNSVYSYDIVLYLHLHNIFSKFYKWIANHQFSAYSDNFLKVIKKDECDDYALKIVEMTLKESFERQYI